MKRLAAQVVDSIKAAEAYAGKDNDKMKFYLRAARSSASDVRSWVEKQ